MKKKMMFIFTLLFSLLLTACGTAEPSVAPEESETDNQELQLFLETTSYTEDYEKDGVLLATLRLSYPKLKVVTEDGEEFAAPEGEDIEQVRIAENFNIAMSAAMSEKQTYFVDMRENAKLHYEELDEEMRQYWTPYALEVNCESYESDTLISTLATGYWNAGGAHPTSFYEAKNFDFTHGRFFTLGELSDDAEPCRSAVAEEVIRQIREQGMDEWYYEDFETVVRDFVGTQMSFDDEGMTVLFEEGVLGPHAAGLPRFYVDYGVFGEYLNEYGKNLLSVQ
jgi:hypothetical protein